MKKSYRFVLCAVLAAVLCLSVCSAFAAPPPPPGKHHAEYHPAPGPKPEPHHAPKPDPHRWPKPGPGRYYDPHYEPHRNPPPPPDYRPAPEPERGESTSPGVWVMPQGQGFHRFMCKFIKGRRGLRNMTAEEALRRGYRPCRTCFPEARH